MRDTTYETGIFEVQTDGPFNVSRYDARIGDLQLTINLKLLALGHELARISDAILETHEARTGEHDLQAQPNGIARIQTF